MDVGRFLINADIVKIVLGIAQSLRCSWNSSEHVLQPFYLNLYVSRSLKFKKLRVDRWFIPITSV